MKAFAATPDHLSSISGTHRVEGENPPLRVDSTSTHTHACAHTINQPTNQCNLKRASGTGTE